MSRTEFESQLNGSTPLFSYFENRNERPLRDSPMIERFFSRLQAELLKQEDKKCR